MKLDHISPQPDENFFPSLSNKRKAQMSNDKTETATDRKRIDVHEDGGRNSKPEEHTADVVEHGTACLAAADAKLACAN
jgi:hypothetical protein